MLGSMQMISSDDLSELLIIKKRIDPDDTYVGQSVAILRCIKQIEILNISPTKSVLILGPTGVGKTVLASLIHSSTGLSPKLFHREQPADNMATDFIIIKARWVGYGKNSGLTNVPKEGRTGLLQEFAGGTILVDEMHGLPEVFQRFMLDVLDGSPIPLAAGEGSPVTPQIRLIFGTNVDPTKSVLERKLLPDFYRRIKTGVVRIPSLAERMEDIPLFLQRKCKGYKWSAGFLLGLLDYSWPHNVGELIDVLDLAKNEAVAQGTKKLAVEHLTGHADHALVERIRKMPEKDAENHVFLMLRKMLERKGWVPGNRKYPLQRELAKLMAVSPSKVTRLSQQSRVG
jgi:transcriptional regulator with AAA-type ATPase domain